MSLIEACNNFLVILVEKLNGRLWYLVLFYGASKLKLREKVFENLEDYLKKLVYPYLIVGDFNEVDYGSDKLSARNSYIRGACSFNNWKLRNELLDIPFKGRRFTWCNNRKGEHRVYERLDKALGFKEWFTMFPETGIKHHPIQISDHAPIEIDLNLTKPNAFRVARKLARVRQHVKKWALDKRNEWSGKWDDFDKRLEHGIKLATSGDGEAEYELVNAEVRDFAKAVAIYWKQRAKLRWMVDGDTCTKRVSNDDADSLGKLFTTKEVRQAVFQMDPMKSPGPDSIPAIFYQRCWHLVKKDCMKAILSILNSGTVLKEMNRTFIALVPKCDSPEEVKDYRPISLCNVFMGIVTKCITNRMQKVMGYLVGDYQNAFLSGRSISDNILLAHEAIHKVKHKRGKFGKVAFKADMSKAFDRVKWDFLQAILLKFGFPERLVNLIMSCVSTGIRLCRGVTPLTHIFFADDSVFFFQNKCTVLRSLKRLLVSYCDASGQHNKGFGKYLGLPTEFQESKKDVFKGLMESVTKRISSWNGIFLYLAGRLTLISFVLSNLSIFFLSVFKIPVSVTKRINALLSHFWWAGSKSGKCLHWFSRTFTSIPKREGGLGVRNVDCLNQALLAKHAWRLMSNEGLLFCLIFREKIMGTENQRWLYSKKSLSWGTRSIIHGLKFIMEHIGWKLGLDSNLNVWDKKWVNGGALEPKDCLLVASFMFSKDLRVKDICFNNGGWNEGLFNLLFAEESVNQILAIPLHESQAQDEILWPFINSGKYTVKSGYGIIFNGFLNEHVSRKDKERVHTNWRLFCKKKLWHLPGPQTWKILLWKNITDSLPVGSKFIKRDMTWASSCVLCGNGGDTVETLGYLFRDCAISSRIWAGSVLGVNADQSPTINVRDWIFNWILYLIKLDDGVTLVIHFLVILVSLWNLRNNINPGVFFSKARQLVEDVLQLRGKVNNDLLHPLGFEGSDQAGKILVLRVLDGLFFESEGAISYVRRDRNSRAHDLAKQAMSMH
ncbi:uncharacterized protein LOC141632177 [Silene latifolia]|uniref:uncharacterized protein LOC141632177 n=1 Tax=Silene latifolia TaxID=37657 RepID=UPI003D781CFB